MVIDIRLLSESDTPAAWRLSSLASWNQTENDWKRLIALEPNGCFCATSDDRVVATTTTTTYGIDLAWIGMVLVDPDYQRRGIATELMKVAMSYLEKARVRSIKLDATQAGYPVYERLGFIKESLVERWEGTVRDVDVDSMIASEPRREELFSFDKQAFGTDRSLLIDILSSDSVVAPQFVRSNDGKLSGYGLARRGSVATYVGPIAANDRSTAMRLIDGLLAELVGQRVFIDLNMNFGGRQILSDRGFAKQRDLVRMSYGGITETASSSSIVAIAGPEVG